MWFHERKGLCSPSLGPGFVPCVKGADHVL